MGAGDGAWSWGLGVVDRAGGGVRSWGLGLAHEAGGSAWSWGLWVVDGAEGHWCTQLTLLTPCAPPTIMCHQTPPSTPWASQFGSEK